MARDWLKLAADAYSSSTSYVDSNYRKKWEDGLRMFQSRHPLDSKYLTETYKHRSKIFRPKSRALVKKHEAATAAAFFSNNDVISCSAVNENDQKQAASAALWKEVINYRLTKSIPWFQTVTGAMQDAMTVGVVCSYQHWVYEGEDHVEYVTQAHPLTGLPVLVEQKKTVALKDKPCVELIPVENIRIDPGASWIDPINSSPYVIRMIPMYITDVKSMMEKVDPKTGTAKWKKLTDGQIRSAMKLDNDSTKQVREQTRQSSTDAGNAPLTDFEVVWVHENFMRIDGKEMVYYTLGVEFMLTEAKPLKEVYFHGERPIVMGVCSIETHKVMPDAPVILGEQLQREANEIVNQRLDNVKLVLNKRYIVKRGAQVDIKSLVRNVPGSVTLANDPTGDVHEMEFNDVTGSSYQEQDRINVDYDELAGNFSQGSVMTNRKMGETVGGMAMISSSANQITEYTIRTFTETWVEPVLRQVVKLEQKYETDEVILAIAASQAKLLDKFGVNQITDDLLNQELTLTVNVGMGATDPVQKLNKFMGALGAFAQVAQMQLPNVDLNQIGKEVFGLAGYRDGGRFMQDQEQDAQIKQVIEQAQQMVAEAKQETAMKQQALAEEVHKALAERANLEKMAAQIDANSKLLSEREQSAAENIRLRQEVLLAKTDAAATKATDKINIAALQLEKAMGDIMGNLNTMQVEDSPEVENETNKIAQLFAEVTQGQQEALQIFSNAMIEQASAHQNSSETNAAVLAAIQRAMELQSRPKVGTLSNGKQIRIESA